MTCAHDTTVFVCLLDVDGAHKCGFLDVAPGLEEAYRRCEAYDPCAFPAEYCVDCGKELERFEVVWERARHEAAKLSARTAGDA